MRLFFFLFIFAFVISGLEAAGEEAKSGKSLRQTVASTIVRETNQFREENGLEPLSVSEELSETASSFAMFMAENEKYGHRADGRTPAERAKASGYEYCVVRENIAYRTNPTGVTAESLVDVFVKGWIESPPHRENMLADFVTETGVAVATIDDVTYYAVQLFGRPKSAAITFQVTNQSSESQALVIHAGDSEDVIEMPPRSVVRVQRCFPATLWLRGSDTKYSVNTSTQLVINEDGIEKS